MPKKLICVNCGKDCKTVVRKGNKVFCCQRCANDYKKTKKEPEICKYC